jgi:hypothetical protein
MPDPRLLAQIALYVTQKKYACRKNEGGDTRCHSGFQHFGRGLGLECLSDFTGTFFGSGFLVVRVGLHFVFSAIQ